MRSKRFGFVPSCGSVLVVFCGWLLSPGFVAVEATGSDAIAQIASVRNRVETRHIPDPAWSDSFLNEQLSGKDRVRTGPASRAGILHADQTLQRLGENSELELVAPEAEKPGFLRLLLGKHYFSSRRPKEQQRIETPTVVASIRGTEFVVEVAEDTSTTITLLEGVVEAANEYGSLVVRAGEQAYVEPGKAPVRRIVVRPRDAVAWALYYPPVLGGADARRLDGLGDDGKALAEAAELLSAGQVDRARPLIEAVLARRPTEAIALALSSVTAVATSDRAEALKRAEAAVTAGPDSPAAALALSFAAQALFDIPRARSEAERAASLDRDGSLAAARAAELRMAEGDLAGAEAAATEAVTRDPRSARALSVQGFVRLATYRTRDAEALFERAVAADPEAPTARLGLGLARLRRGRVDEGRAEIQIATALDPADSLLRSYLGKVYYEQKRNQDAGKEFAAAKQLDPADPTPYLYDAIRLQNQNRPAEALRELLQAIERNDQRAVYRSRQLLDEDLAVKGVDLARIFNDLGFDQLGALTARRSADADQSNYSSHHLLAGTYRNLPGAAPAFFSELLQARIYQPVSVNAARPDVVNETVSFNEYTALFDRPRKRLFATVALGETDTDLSELFPQGGAPLASASLADSDVQNTSFVGTVNGDRFAAAVGYDDRSSDGFRRNNDRDVENIFGLFQFAATPRDGLQLSLRAGDEQRGDLPLRLFTADVDNERFDTDQLNVGAGYHRVLSPGSDLAVSAIHNETEQTVAGGGTGSTEGVQLEVQLVRRRAKHTWVFGAGGFDGEVELRSDAETLRSDDRFANGYAYLHLRPWRRVEWTLGIAAERVVAPIGLLLPRDAQYDPVELEYSDTRLSPKLGVTVLPTRGMTLRAAAFGRVSPAVGRIQSLEPTQVAGFNQFFFEPGGTRSTSYGVGLDQRFSRRFFAGFGVLRRERTVPEAYCPSPGIFFECANRPITRRIERTSEDYVGSAYFNAVLHRTLSLAVDFSFDQSEFDVFKLDNRAMFHDELETQRLRPQLRFHLPNGLFAAVRGNYFDQTIGRYNFFSPLFRTHSMLKVDFWLVDLELGYRLPRRWGSIVVRARNLGDREFGFFDQALEEDLVPARVVTVSLSLTL